MHSQIAVSYTSLVRELYLCVSLLILNLYGVLFLQRTFSQSIWSRFVIAMLCLAHRLKEICLAVLKLF